MCIKKKKVPVTVTGEQLYANVFRSLLRFRFSFSLRAPLPNPNCSFLLTAHEVDRLDLFRAPRRRARP